MAGKWRLSCLLTLILVCGTCASLDMVGRYDPVLDEEQGRGDEDVFVMRNGRPDMRIMEKVLENQQEKEEFIETDPPPEEEEEEEDQEITTDNRKRFMVDNPKRIWDYGIMPYKLNASLSAKQRASILNYAMPKYEYWTHFRFVEWNTSVPALYNLTHQNFLRFIAVKGCWSNVGNLRKKHGNQTLSCCGGNACVHEIGHSIGFHHEQSNPLGKDYIRINRQNIIDGDAGNFNTKSLHGNRAFGYFDMSSIMEYGLKAFSKNRQETISVFDPELRYMFQHSDNTAFYMFYEAQTMYKMKEQKCPDFPMTCVNDGYVSFINNTCQCRCTTGMDPTTGCATPISAVAGPGQCGGTIYLSGTNHTQTISTPLFPAKFSGGQCTWFIKGPPGSRIVMNFEDFSIHTGDQKTCNGHLEIRYMLPGQPGVMYCGKGYNKTTVSHIDSLVLILSKETNSTQHHRRFLVDPPAVQRSHASRRFRATVTLYREEDMCYTNGSKDDSYRGHVNVGQKFETCLPWDSVTHCQHNTFKDLEYDLEENYCRNPGVGTEPWCYTDAETCARTNCDVCQLRNCYDLFEDCPQQVTTNPRYCTTDPEAQRGCRKTCGLCGSIPKTAPVTVTRCGTPSTIPDGVPQSKVKVTYNVGDKLTYACRTNHLIQHPRMCTSEGTWSRLTYVCDGCLHGWTEYKGSCYKMGSGIHNKRYSSHMCHNMAQGARLADAETEGEGQFLHGLVGNTKIWLGGSNHVSHGHNHLVLDNHHTVNYTNWLTGHEWPETGHTRCIVMLNTTKWDNVDCGLKKNFVCKYPSEAHSVCADQRPDCQHLLTRTTDMCQRYGDTFAKVKCARTCGLCSGNQTLLDGSPVPKTHQTCQVTGQPVNATMVTNSQPIKFGETVEYQCNHGYHVASGDLLRACLLTGSLTGSAPRCLADDDRTTFSNNLTIRRRSKAGSPRLMYILNEAHLAINRTGEITAWEFYSNYDGQMALQVWRQVGNGSHYTLVGQNVIDRTLDDRKVSVDIPNNKRVKVNPGDAIGIYYPQNNHGGITFDDCNFTYEPEGHLRQTRYHQNHVTDWHVGKQFNTKAVTRCHVFSLRAVIGPI